MVLTILISILSLCLNQAPLTEKYHKQVSKNISKSFSKGSLDLKPIDFRRGELSKIYIDKNFQGHILIAEVAACNLGGCSSFENVKKDKNSEYFDLLLILNKEEEIVTIKILDYFSDYGYEITSKNYLKKYLGKQPCDFKNEIDGIDAISGATISSYALEGMISTMCEKL